MELYYNTVNYRLRETLNILMAADEFSAFRLVGGTSLSLQLGHRLSIDIDLFTDAEYKSIDFDVIDNYLRREFVYVDSPSSGDVAFGKSYYVGASAHECIKLDLFYTDRFIRDAIVVDGIRMASIEDIAAMKVDVIQRTGRKKDFWDIHKLLDTHSIETLLLLHEERYPYTHERDEIISKFTNFTYANGDFDPVCLLHKEWGIIKLDIIDAIETYL
ncbi:MAG: nucleotidyl transferase AbiEii/AbiGii toxin family protein [Rikenellaceae bacterium]